MKKSLLIYLATLALFGLGSACLLKYGSRLDAAQAVGQSPPRTVATAGGLQEPAESGTILSHIGHALAENARSPLSTLLLQIIVIVAAARLCGKLFQRLAQPAVIGEMIAGILLGPSLLGLLSPGAMSLLFPEPSIGSLKMLSQFGVVIFMFIVGMELNARHLREKAHAAILISHASIIVPFFLGIALSLFLYRSLPPGHAPFIAFALFIGVAMSITAFPVLARILEERGLAKTPIGATTLACAAVDDVTAWCLLAFVVAVSRADGLVSFLLPLILSLLFIGVMLLFLKPRLESGMGRRARDGGDGAISLPALLVFVFACAWLTELIGIHALFGGFLAGVVMPADAGFRLALKEKLEPFSTSLLLPLYFAFTGLRTNLNLLDGWDSWLIGAGIFAVAIGGKLGGSMFAARWTGMNWRESFSVGALMNTRGLVELIVLNIGYEMGILPASIFSMMVLMALVTTCMTGPLLSLAARLEKRKSSGARFEAPGPWRQEPASES
jgi:Kef-type K+ transport system membrane component KefB